MANQSKTQMSIVYWPSFLLFAGARSEHSIVSPLLQTEYCLEPRARKIMLDT